MLSLSRVSKHYRRNGLIAVRALEAVSLQVNEGEFVVVQGPSGSGKTTLLLVAGGLLAPTEGRVEYDSSDVYSLSQSQRDALRASRIGFVFQQFHLISYLDVRENVLAPSLACPEPAGAEERARELLARFNLTERERHFPAELSTGERQRVCLARALLNRPNLLLADEPTGNLDRENAKIVLDCLGDFARAGGAVLMATHSREAAACGDRQLVLAEGRLAGLVGKVN
jgi:ABC-type lipoprotein export system ATPase subunit